MKSEHGLMSDQKVRLWTGAFGIVAFVVVLVAAPLYFIGPPAVPPQDAGFTNYVTQTNNFIVARATLADPLIISCLLVFLAGYRHLIRQARSDYEWVSTLVFGAGLLFVALSLVGDALEGAAALDTAVGANPSAVRAMIEGTILIHNGSTAFAMTAFFLVVAAYATFATGILPRWTAWVALIAAGLCVACVPAMYFGPIDSSGFYNAGGWGPAIIANFPPAIWFLAVSVLLVWKRIPTTK